MLENPSDNVKLKVGIAIGCALGTASTILVGAATYSAYLGYFSKPGFYAGAVIGLFATSGAFVAASLSCVGFWGCQQSSFFSHKEKAALVEEKKEITYGSSDLNIQIEDEYIDLSTYIHKM